MLNTILIFLFISLSFLEYFHSKLQLLPRYVTWTPEIICIILLFIITIKYSFSKILNISYKYLMLFVIYISVIFCGIVLNKVSASNIIIGIRNYLVFLPLFILPAIYEIKYEDVKKQFKLLIVILLIQVPIAIYQRLIQYKDIYTGDVVTGSFLSPGVLSILIIGAISICYSFYLRGRVKLKNFLIFSLIIFIPAMINETKATIFLLSAGIICTSLIEKEGNKIKKIKNIFLMLCVLTILLSSFTILYDKFYKKDDLGKPGLLDNINMLITGRSYLYYGERANEENNRKIGRIDAILLANKELSENIGTYMFGVGIGNAHQSYFNKDKANVYNIDELGGGQNVISSLMWEIGILGLFCYILFLIFIFLDASILKNEDGFFGTFALGWISIVIIMLINLIYKNTFFINVINMIFFYFSGIISTKAFNRIRKNNGSISHKTFLSS